MLFLTPRRLFAATSVWQTLAAAIRFKSFDVGILSIRCNLDRQGCIQALSEIERVARGHSFITVDAFRDDAEMKRMFDWNLTARTVLSVEDWILLFGDAGYTGDYYWFTP